MHFGFSDDQLAFRDAFADFLAAECPPHAVRAIWDDADGPGYDPAVWAKLAAMGVVGLTAPEACGGLGLREVDLVLLLEAAGRAALAAPLLETTAVGIPLLVDVGETRWIADATAGDAVITVGLARDPYVAYGDSAAVLLVERDDELHAIDPRDERVRLARKQSVDRSRRLTTVSWQPTSDTLVAEGPDVRRSLAIAADRGALAAAAQLCGVAAHLLDVTVDYAKQRRQFGAPIGSYQAVKHALANACVAIEHARPVVQWAAWAMSTEDAGTDPAVAASMAKAVASDAATMTARVALQVHGAIGYTWEHDLHLWLKRAWVLAAAWGDAAWHRRRVADAVV